jgi:hypothetical protein
VLMVMIMPNLGGIPATQFISNIDPAPMVAMTSNVSCEHIAICFQEDRSHSSWYHLAPLTQFRNERCFIKVICERGLVRDAREVAEPP